MRIIVLLFLECSKDIFQALFKQIFIFGFWIPVVLAYLCEAFVYDWITELSSCFLCSSK
jgi:hypothetical protein